MHRVVKNGPNSEKKKLLYRRLPNRCIYCGSTKNLTIEHLTPLSRGGTNEMENLGLSCHRCNNSKGHLTDEEYRRFLVDRTDCTVCLKQIRTGNWLNGLSHCSNRCVRLERALTESPIFARLVYASTDRKTRTMLLQTIRDF